MIDLSTLLSTFRKEALQNPLSMGFPEPVIVSNYWEILCELGPPTEKQNLPGFLTLEGKKVGHGVGHDRGRRVRPPFFRGFSPLLSLRSPDRVSQTPSNPEGASFAMK